MILLLAPKQAIHAENNSVLPKAQTPSMPAVAHPNNEMVLEPSMQFIESISVDSSRPATSTVPMAKKTITPPKESPLSIPQIQNVITPPPPVVKGASPTSIKRDLAPFDIHEIEERFKNNSNPHLGLYIARYHYDHQNYSESYNYALKTNAINNSIEESWLIFAKSLIKLGKNDQAKKTLQLYITQTNSENAKILLDSIAKETTK